MPNPFKPTAGSNPPVLIGRQEQLEDFSYALEDGPGAPGRLLFLTGTRGIGKTVLLNAIGEIAANRKWDVINETANRGFLQRITTALASTKKYGSLAGVKLPSVSVGLTPTPANIELDLGEASFEQAQSSLTFRTAATQRLEKLEKKNRGLLITLDEVQAGDMEELRSLATGAQHLIREQHNVAFIFAGLPNAVEDMLNDDVLTFLRRAERVHLQDIPLSEVRDSFKNTIESNGKTVSDDVLEQLVVATVGYPFMIQLVGYWVWRSAGNETVITETAATQGIHKAKVNIGNLVHAPEFDNLSAMQKNYLLAMSQDQGPSRTSDIAQRIERTAQNANNYRSQLIEADLIYAPEYGYVDFKMPFMREYLQNHAASQMWKAQ